MKRIFRLIIAPWRIINAPVHALQRRVLARTRAGSIIHRLAEHNVLRTVYMSFIVGFIGVGFFLLRKHEVIHEITELTKEFCRAIVVYPAAERAFSFVANKVGPLFADAAENAVEHL